MRVLERLVAAVSVALYLCAAFTPCPSVAAMDSIARIAARGPLAPAQAASTAAHSHSMTDAPRGAEAHHGDHSGHGDHDDHGADVARAAHRTHADSALVWMPTCLCGCSETRAWIGGGTARLGPVIPVALDVRPMPMMAASAVTHVFNRKTAPTSIADPIPT